MLSLDVALAASPAVDRVVAMSGVMLADSLAGLRATRVSRPPVFISHGRQDQMLPFMAAEKAKGMLDRHGSASSGTPSMAGTRSRRTW